MMKYVLTLGLALATLTAAKGQTLRIRSNSIENLHVVAVGVDKGGQVTQSDMLYDFEHDQYKVVSLFEEKYGYDHYHNKDMKHEGFDHTARWTKLLIYDGSNVLYDTIDLTKPAKKLHTVHGNIIVKVKVRQERDYVITDVVLTDDGA